ncbi:MAG: SCO family protein [Caulobacteraceae bacterium]
MNRISSLLTLCLIAAALALSGCAREEKNLTGGPFQLVDQNGRAADESLLKGKWSAVFFGFTYCPDVCPATLQTLAEAEDRLGRKAEKLQVVFISVDPERDTSKVLKEYLASPGFPKRTIGLTGSPQAVASAAKAYRVYYRKAGDGPGYQVEHTSAIYLMNPKGRFVRVLAHGLTPDETAKLISDAMSGR